MIVRIVALRDIQPLLIIIFGCGSYSPVKNDWSRTPYRSAIEYIMMWRAIQNAPTTCIATMWGDRPGKFVDITLRSPSSNPPCADSPRRQNSWYTDREIYNMLQRMIIIKVRENSYILSRDSFFFLLLVAHDFHVSAASQINTAICSRWLPFYGN